MFTATESRPPVRRRVTPTQMFPLSYSLQRLPVRHSAMTMWRRQWIPMYRDGSQDTIVHAATRLIRAGAPATGHKFGNWTLSNICRLCQSDDPKITCIVVRSASQRDCPHNMTTSVVAPQYRAGLSSIAARIVPIPTERKPIRIGHDYVAVALRPHVLRRAASYIQVQYAATLIDNREPATGPPRRLGSVKNYITPHCINCELSRPPAMSLRSPMRSLPQ